uniref:Transposon Ty3-I Gag-Pol polyprotein n=1 Tax=Cajanus cajan TaxID=3821 RepID=A0A151RER2_CAJCA|nr:hypothetical protein KK1_037684 [Cajanus cajan]
MIRRLLNNQPSGTLSQRKNIFHTRCNILNNACSLIVDIVDQQVKVKLSIGKYEDEVLCDVVPMEACHILLGRPWKFDKKTMHNGLTNEISFTYKEKKFVLHHLSPQQVAKDQAQMKLKRDSEKRLQKKEENREREKSVKTRSKEKYREKGVPP